LRSFEKQSFFKQPEKLKINLQDLSNGILRIAKHYDVIKDSKPHEIPKEEKQSTKDKKITKKNQGYFFF